MIVGIDGPAGSGKGTVTKKVANILGLTTIDTGSTYRCVALDTLNRGISIDNKEEIIKIAGEIKIEIKHENELDRVFLNGKEVTKDIRSKEVTDIVSPISSIPEVRIKMVQLQRRLAERKKYYNGRKRYLYICISKCRCKNLFRCKHRRKGK